MLVSQWLLNSMGDFSCLPVGPEGTLLKAFCRDHERSVCV